MSREGVRLEITALLRRDNTAEDDEHIRLYELLVDRVRAVVDDVEFRPIIAEVQHDGLYWLSDVGRA